jgi:hypothetical protein
MFEDYGNFTNYEGDKARRVECALGWLEIWLISVVEIIVMGLWCC